MYCVFCLVAKSCLTFCDPMECSLPGSSVYAVSQATIQEWIAISYSKGSFKPREPVSPASAGGFFTVEPPGKLYHIYKSKKKLLPHTFYESNVYEGIKMWSDRKWYSKILIGMVYVKMGQKWKIESSFIRSSVLSVAT